MRTLRPNRRDERGQVLALFVISLTVIVLAVGLVIDGGTALLQRRASQNASDFAALAGARVIAERIGGDTSNGTDGNVQAAITTSISANGGTPVTFGAPNGPRYVDSNGAALGYVGNGSIPGYPVSGPCTVSCAVGVTVASSRSWTPYFLGIIGVNNWSAGATSTARGGYAAGGPSGAVFPVGIAEAFFNNRTSCSGPISADPASPCYPQHLTPGDLNVPGGFGWLKFGCVGYGLGQVPPASNGGCANSKPFLQTEIGPPPNSFGCCTAVKLPGSADLIGSLPGNKASADCSYYINSGAWVTVPVWDSAGGTGQNAYYHIVGFTGWQLTACDGGKDIEGVWRVPFFLGPTTTTPGFAGAPLAVQLIK
jgi:Flp pilus assembly protein TadG